MSIQCLKIRKMNRIRRMYIYLSPFRERTNMPRAEDDSTQTGAIDCVAYNKLNGYQ